MTEETVSEDSTKYTKITETGPNSESKIFIYEILKVLPAFKICVIAPNATVAKENLKKQFPSAEIVFKMSADKVMQIQ